MLVCVVGVTVVEGVVVVSVGIGGEIVGCEDYWGL